MKKITSLIIAVLLISGCVTTNQLASEEVKISKTTGIGVMEYQTVVNEMTADTYNYVLLSIRNNADGNNAKEIIASLDNVEPFTIYECNLEHKANDVRYDVCNQFFDDYEMPYRSHRITQMIPDEEIQFFWNIRAPNNQEIVDMAYTQDIYYTLEYNYTSTVTQTIAAISQEEYLKRSQEGPVNLKGQTISSPGEIKIESSTQQPLIYSEGNEVPLDFALEFQITNTGDGVPKPGTEILIAVKNDSLLSYGAYGDEWEPYDGTSKYSEWFDEIFPYVEFEELGPEGGSIRKQLMLTKVSAEQMRNGNYGLVLPMKFHTQGVFEPQKILTVSAYISYKYLKEGSTTISVYPTE